MKRIILLLLIFCACNMQTIEEKNQIYLQSKEYKKDSIFLEILTCVRKSQELKTSKFLKRADTLLNILETEYPNSDEFNKAKESIKIGRETIEIGRKMPQ